MAKSKLEIDRQIFVDQCQIYTRKLEKAKCDYHRNKIAECDDRQLFRLVDKMCRPETASSRVLPSHDNAKSLANKFADFFHAKIKNLRKDIDSSVHNSPSVDIHDTRCCSSFRSFSAVTEDTVAKTITGRNAIGLKVARVIPLLKKSSLDQEELKNYRPISNLKFLFKTIERIASSQLHAYLDKNKLHSPMQSAFRKFHSTETALLRVQNDLLRAVDKHQEAVLILLDYSAAFDTIDHKILIRRLCQRYGITDTALKWFSSYVQGRTQCIDINGTLSDEYRLMKVSHRARLSLPPLAIGDSAISASKAARDLGVVIDESLDMKDHLKNVSKAASFAIYRIGKIRKYLDQNATERST
ncbi:uncharacterized protein [Amphiura filiformis]|uniref:uncharacterized protein n=1 Tax=Amphiura filiformis TaxID=82378 RepID=UPI003B22308C